ncbi:MAG: FAD-binding protein [Phycisphaerales bacterium]|nr:FAD-binding protein [Phycisphaerales bacterium]
MGLSEHAEASDVLREIGAAITGEIRTDRLARALYATDASIYEIVPDGVIFPRTVADVSAAVRICAQRNLPLTARGGGTGLTGGAVNRGAQLDCSRYLNRVLSIDAEKRTARVEPGVVLDELNAALKPHGLHYAPDVATSSRANVGGMISNNSCGAHSVMFGRTCDHLLGVDVVLADGSTYSWGQDATPSDNPLAKHCEEVVRAVRSELAADVEARYPKVLRRNGGYALDRLNTEGRLNVEQLICGSEGTLGVVVGATVNLIPLPAYRGMVVAHFDKLLDALGATPRILTHETAAVELVDRMILDATRTNPSMMRRRHFISDAPAAILICEIYEESEARLNERLNALADDLRGAGLGYAHPVITDAPAQDDVWYIRKAGLGLLTSKPGDRQSHAFVEDSAVDPSRLRDYIKRFDEILDEEGVKERGYYAHASVGCIHARPVLNLKRGDDVQRMFRVADRISSLALEFGGTMTGEHGDGIIRSVWLEKMYGVKIIDGFRRIKSAFDPQGILNPGKIVDPLPMTSNLRYGAGFESRDYVTNLDFSTHGGMAGLAGMCSGVGQCRQRLVGTMCPSYMATGEETHTTRARANALRIALSNRDLLDGLEDPALKEVFDLCLSCKACKTECPTGTDIAKLKAEWQAYMHRRTGVPKRSRLIADSVGLAGWGSMFAPLSNWVMQSGIVRGMMERRYGLDRRVPPPKFVRQTFRKWFAKHRRERGERKDDQPKVVLFVDTWTNHYVPQQGIATVKVLEAMGYHIVVPNHVCCGRPMISKGLLPEAKLLAEQNAQKLAGFAERGVPIVGIEPSCVSALTDELPQFVRTPRARIVAGMTQLVDGFVAAAIKERPDALKLDTARLPEILYHGHCHQKALYGTSDTLKLLRAGSPGACEINSGCCGMAGSFGHEAEHYDVAKAVGEQRLFPAVRERGNSQIAVSGFSCRHQIEHHTDAHVRHVMEYLADALG